VQRQAIDKNVFPTNEFRNQHFIPEIHVFGALGRILHCFLDGHGKSPKVQGPPF